LRENDIPALCGIDTRALTKKIRSQGVLLGKIRFPKQPLSPSQVIDRPMSRKEWDNLLEPIEFHDPNTTNLVKEGEWDA
jgi:carbamoyl-phosphate synthase/aspartate carbamoyltransferase